MTDRSWISHGIDQRDLAPSRGFPKTSGSAGGCDYLQGGPVLLPGTEFVYKGIRIKMGGYDYSVMVHCSAEAVGLAA